MKMNGKRARGRQKEKILARAMKMTGKRARGRQKKKDPGTGYEDGRKESKR